VQTAACSPPGSTARTGPCRPSVAIVPDAGDATGADGPPQAATSNSAKAAPLVMFVGLHAYFFAKLATKLSKSPRAAFTVFSGPVILKKCAGSVATMAASRAQSFLGSPLPPIIGPPLL